MLGEPLVLGVTGWNALLDRSILRSGGERGSSLYFSVESGSTLGLPIGRLKISHLLAKGETDFFEIP